LHSDGLRQGSLQKTERLKSFSKLLAVFSVLLTPWLIQVVLCPSGQVPTGYLIGWEDYWTFITKIEWGRLGNWTYTNQLTPETTGPVPIYLFYLFLGHISKWTGLSVLWVFHLARSAVGTTFLYLWWKFCRNHIQYPVVTALLGVFASFGFLGFLPMKGAEYLESFVQGHAAHIGLLGFTHYLFDGIAFLLLLDAYLTRKHIAVKSVLAGALLGMVHPFLLPLFPVILLVHSAIKRNFGMTVKMIFWSAIGSLPFVVPLFITYLNEPWLSGWREQTAIPFAWWETLILISLTFGLAGIIAWVKIPRAIKGNNLQQISAIWLIVAGLMVFFIPLPNNREYAFFLSLPISIIATPVFVEFFNRINTQKINWVLISLILFSCFYGGKTAVFTCVPNDGSYLPREMVDGLEWLRSQPEGIVACSSDVGLTIPVYTGYRPYVAHTSETIDAERKNEQVREFFKSEKPIPADYAVLTKKFDPKAPALKWEPVFTNSEITIWKIKEDES
jgi:hypothetical protein